MKTDLSYTVSGLWVKFYPNTAAGVEAWKELQSQPVLVVHLSSVIAQLKQAGYTIRKAPLIKKSAAALLAELGI